MPARDRANGTESKVLEAQSVAALEAMISEAANRFVNRLSRQQAIEPFRHGNTIVLNELAIDPWNAEFAGVAA